MNASMAIQDLAGEVYDLLADAPEGLTKYDMAAKLSMPIPAISRAIRSARETLGEDDTLFILCEPQGSREPWLYRLVDGSTLIDFAESAWVPNRVRDAQSRVSMIALAMAIASRATDGRSIDGRKARAMTRQLGRLVEDLEEIDLDAS
jgi:hypothetical protein